MNMNISNGAKMKYQEPYILITSIFWNSLSSGVGMSDMSALIYGVFPPLPDIKCSCLRIALSSESWSDISPYSFGTGIIVGLKR